MVVPYITWAQWSGQIRNWFLIQQNRNVVTHNSSFFHHFLEREKRREREREIWHSRMRKGDPKSYQVWKLQWLPTICYTCLPILRSLQSQVILRDRNSYRINLVLFDTLKLSRIFDRHKIIILSIHDSLSINFNIHGVPMNKQVRDY